MHMRMSEASAVALAVAMALELKVDHQTQAPHKLPPSLGSHQQHTIPLAMPAETQPVLLSQRTSNKQSTTRLRFEVLLHEDPRSLAITTTRLNVKVQAGQEGDSSEGHSSTCPLPEQVSETYRNKAHARRHQGRHRDPLPPWQLRETTRKEWLGRVFCSKSR